MPRAGAEAALLYCHLEQRYQKRGGSASPCHHEDTAPGKRNHNLVLWWGRETSKHMWCMACGTRRHVTRGLSIARSMLPLYQVLFCCSGINRLEGRAANFRSHLANRSLWLPSYSASDHSQDPAALLYPPLPATRMTLVPWGHSCHNHCCKHTSSDGNSLLLQENHHLLPFLGIFSFTSWSMVLCECGRIQDEVSPQPREAQLPTG